MLEVLGLGDEAEKIYRSMLANPSWGVADLASYLDIDEISVRTGLSQLFELDLLRRSAERTGELRAISPALGLQTLLARQQAEIESRMRRITAGQAAVAAIVAEYAGDAEPATGHDAEPVIGGDAIQGRLEELAARVSDELLSIVPTVPSAEVAEQAARNNLALLERNVTIRTAMQDAARNSPIAVTYAQSLTGSGAEVRTAPLLPPRMLIFDRSVAVVPIDPDATSQGIVQLTGRGVVASMVSLFEQVWATAVPLGTSVARDERGVTPVEVELLKMLGQGHTDGSAARQLGISERSCRRLMAELMERLGARSRFEAGLLAAREGWL